jgi:hypothetical protein
LLWAEESDAGNREFSVKREIAGIGRKRVIGLLYRQKGAASGPA